MLSEYRVQNLIQPIITAQADFEYSVLQKIALKIRQISTMPYSSALALVRASIYGEDVIAIHDDLQLLSKTQIQRINKVLAQVAEYVYEEAETLYKHRNLDYRALSENKELSDLVKLLIDEADDEYLKCINDPVFVIRQNPVSQTKTTMPIITAYNSVLNEAAQKVQTKTNFNSGMLRTINQLLESGLRTIRQDELGIVKTYRLTNFVANFLWGKVKQINTAMQAVMAKQFGADGIELSAHINSAPDHEPVQGRQFLKEEFDKLQSYEAFKDIHNNIYAPIRRPIGAWNCRHWTMAIIVGVSVPEYTERQLKTMEKENAQGYTAPDGKHYTMYECTQIQRRYENSIADYRQRYEIAKIAKNDELAQRYSAKYAQLVNTYKAFSRACNLPINQNKI